MAREAIRKLFHSVEALLNIDSSAPARELTRSRAVYVVAWFLGMIQALNTLGLYFTFGGWALDVYMALAATIVLFGSVVCLRWTKNFALFAYCFGILLLGATTISAIESGTGVNSALVPLICVGPMVIGYIHDWRSALVYGVAASLLLIGLYHFVNVDPKFVSLFSITPSVQRLLQAQFALLLSTVVAVNFSHNTYFSMTQLEKSLSRAKRAEAAKSEFLATMSHELRTPLNGVIGMAEALAASNLGARERELAQVIRRSGESLLVIIGDLLDLSKIEAGKLMIENGPYSIQGLANHTIESWRAASEMKGVDINAVIDEDVPPLVLGDEHRVGQILDNLISNAVKFTTEGSIEMTVRVSEKKRNPHLVMRVQDTGKGVPAGLENQIFEAFEQGEQGTTRRFGGTGLGLPICKKLAQLMDGDIVLERTGPSGSIFRLTMPLEIAPDEPTTAEEAGLEPSEVLHGARVLVAEDNEVNRMVMHEFLTKWGCETVFAHDGPSTLEALEIDRFDVLLLDKHMPGMGGPEVAVTIRKADKPYRSIPIIAVSADTLSGEREEAMAVGMDDYVAKPVRSHVLRETMERVISSHRAAIGDLGFNRETG